MHIFMIRHLNNSTLVLTQSLTSGYTNKTRSCAGQYVKKIKNNFCNLELKIKRNKILVHFTMRPPCLNITFKDGFHLYLNEPRSSLLIVSENIIKW